MIKLSINMNYDFKSTWDYTTAQVVIELFRTSGKSQRTFAKEHGFPEKRLRDWKKKLDKEEELHKEDIAA